MIPDHIFAILIDQSLVQISSQRLPLAPDWSRYRFHNQFTCDEILSQMSPSGSPLRDRSGNTTKEGKEDCNSQKRWRAPEEHVLLNQLSRAHLGSQRLKWKILCLHGYGIGPLCLCYGGQFPVLVIHLRVEMYLPYISHLVILECF